MKVAVVAIALEDILPLMSAHVTLPQDAKAIRGSWSLECNELRLVVKSESFPDNVRSHLPTVMFVKETIQESRLRYIPFGESNDGV